GAVLRRTGERAVQHSGGGKAERVAGVSQAATDLPIVHQAGTGSERVVVVPDPGESLVFARAASRCSRASVVRGSVQSSPLASCGKFAQGRVAYRFHPVVVSKRSPVCRPIRSSQFWTCRGLAGWV